MGHQCKRQLLLLEGRGEEEVEDEEADEVEGTDEDGVEDNGEISPMHSWGSPTTK